MSCKYVVSNITTNEDYIFYNMSKINDNDHTVRMITDGLKEAKAKYSELINANSENKFILTKVYPNYKTGEIKTDLILSNI